MPIDINALRAEKGGNPDLWREMTGKRFKPVELVDKVIDLDEKWRKAQYELEQARRGVGAVQKEIGAKMKAKENADELKAKKADLDKSIEALEATAKELEAARDLALGEVPNELDPTVPVSKDEADNLVVKKHGVCRPSGPDLLHHHEILYMIDGYEPEKGVAVAGHRAYFLKGAGLLLNQALINYGLSFLSSKEYTPLQPPFFMNRDVMAGVAQLGDFDEQLYKVTGEGDADTKYLIATSEQPICAFHKGEWLGPADVPRRYAGFSTCFRKEAGSHGRDAWGIFRVHQFEKVEQFVVCAPEDSARHHDEMIAAAEEFYQSLGLAYHVVNIVSGELNNAAAKKYDLEAWFPTLGSYRELVSASNCTDYQSRAMEVRYSAAGPGGATAAEKAAGAKKQYVHFLNSTLCATTRTICCILENYQTPEGVKVPDVLVPFMGGRTFIPFTRAKPVAGKADKGAAAAGGAGAAPAAAAAPAPKKEKAEAKPAVGGAGAAAAAPAPAAAAAAPAAVAAAPVAAAPAVSIAAAVGSAMSPAVLGIAGRPAAASAAGLAALNSALGARSYVAGHSPSAEDEAVFALLKAAGHADAAKLTAAGHGNAARWFNHIASFSAAERAAWPLTFAQLTSGALNARASTLFA